MGISQITRRHVQRREKGCGIARPPGKASVAWLRELCGAHAVSSYEESLAEEMGTETGNTVSIPDEF